jgi:hypothetical protein
MPSSSVLLYVTPPRFCSMASVLAQSADHGLPVDAEQEGRHVCTRNPGRIPGADQRTHAGPGDAVDRYVQFLQHFQHADMRGAFRSAASEHQTDSWPLGGGHRWRDIRAGFSCLN